MTKRILHWHLGHSLTRRARAAARTEAELKALERLQESEGTTDDYRLGCRLLEAAGHADISNKLLAVLVQPGEFSL